MGVAGDRVTVVLTGVMILGHVGIAYLIGEVHLMAAEAIMVLTPIPLAAITALVSMHTLIRVITIRPITPANGSGGIKTSRGVITAGIITGYSRMGLSLLYLLLHYRQ